MRKHKPSSGRDLRLLEMFILDVLRHDDAEQVSSIVRLLNDQTCIGWRDHWPEDFTTEEVGQALENLFEHEQVEILRETQSGELVAVAEKVESVITTDEDLWFHLTPAGLQSWNAWEPPGVKS